MVYCVVAVPSADVADDDSVHNAPVLLAPIRTRLNFVAMIDIALLVEAFSKMVKRLAMTLLLIFLLFFLVDVVVLLESRDQLLHYYNYIFQCCCLEWCVEVDVSLY